MTTKENTFYLGLCMAGAISAGAYTAGVIDYLIEALDEWQKRKDAGDKNAPVHNVVIPVIGGASAGGMTGIITAASIGRAINHVKNPSQNLWDPIPGNKLYHTWVDLTSDNMLDVMLSDSDLKKYGLRSLLNSLFIDEVATRVVIPGPGPQLSRAYFSEDLKVFTTLSNLDGMTYSVNFLSNSQDLSRFIIDTHSDFACFRMAKTDVEPGDKGWMPLNFENNINARLAAEAAMATGAFPVGLSARRFSRKKEFINEHPWFEEIAGKGKNPFNLDPEHTFVDGGMINNEPFEKVRSELDKVSGQKSKAEKEKFETFRSTVLMVDPFPSEPDPVHDCEDKENSKEPKDPLKLTSVMGKTLGALMNQARIKPSTLAEALNERQAGQFLIAPVRYTDKDERIEGKFAIACGSLGGFGGFVSKDFRIHDFFLGRRNCEQFLRKYFTVPRDTDNPIFKNGYANVPDSQKDKLAHGKQLPIIPLFTKAGEAKMPVFQNQSNWPSISRRRANNFKSGVRSRTHAILMSTDFLNRPARWLVSRMYGSGKIADMVMDTMIKSLDCHKLLR